MVNKTELKNIENKIADTAGFVKKSDYATEITSVKNDYVTNAALTSQIADEIKKVDAKVVKNTSDILNYKTLLDHNKSVINDIERSVQAFYGDQYYNNSWLIFKADYHSFSLINSRYINSWISKGIFNGTLDGVGNSSGNKLDIHLAGETISVNFNGNYFKQPKIDYNRTAIAIHKVYKLNNKGISGLDYVQVNGRFGNCKLTKTTNKSHYGYSDGICVFFYSTGEYNKPYPGKTYRNMLINGGDMTNSIYATDKTDNFYCIGKADTQRLQNGKTIYAEHDYVKANGSEMKKTFMH